jgi:hypothetical protein
MYRHSLLWHCLWLGTPFLQLIIAGAMIKRRLVSSFPAFFSYTLFHAAFSSTFFYLDHESFINVLSHRYFISNHMYWSLFLLGDALNAAFKFAVVYEILQHLIHSYPTLSDIGRGLFKWGFALLVLAALLLAGYGTDGGNDIAVLAGIKTLDRAVGFIQLGLVSALFLLAYHFGLSWRSEAFGIGLGLGIIAAVELGITAVALYAGFSEQGAVFDFVNMGGSVVGAGVWVAYMLRPESAYVTVGNLASHDLELWDRELRRLLER